MDTAVAPMENLHYSLYTSPALIQNSANGVALKEDLNYDRMTIIREALKTLRLALVQNCGFVRWVTLLLQN